MAWRALPLCIQSSSTGNNVTLSCALTEPKDVLQVTWQKDSDKSQNNIATYSTAMGLKIHEPYQDRMSVTSLALNETSITFWDTRMDDSGCYTCLFNVFPLGSFSGHTCLSVLGKVLCRNMSLVEKEVFSHPQHFLEWTQELQW
uniref:Ig-like domain-containing protein n=1 Tax=Strix occidentalis caurina TaxID=311401 RepID=A0A8D0FRR1_STROC